MPVRGKQEPVGIGKGLRTSDPSIAFDQPSIAFSIRLNGATWEKNAWDGGGWLVLGTAAKEHTGNTETQAICDIPFVCRRFKTMRTGEIESTIQCDLRGYGDDEDSQYADKYQTGCILPSVCNQWDLGKISRIYLATSGSNFTEIHFEG